MKKNLLLLTTLTLTTNAFAWGDLGHASVGLIAEKNLSPQGKKFILGLMGGEPLGISAIYPDQMRDDSRYDSFAPYHYFDFPEGTTFETIPTDQRAKRSALVILDQVPDLLTKKKLFKGLSIPQKQILLRYFIHVMGDIHQPLHVGNATDLGGNTCNVKFPDENTGKLYIKNLHSVWDEGVIGHIKKEIADRAQSEQKPIKYFSFKHFAEALIKEAEVNGEMEKLKEQVAKTSKTDWFKESRALHAQVYPDTTPLPPSERTYCKGAPKYDASKVPELSKDYVENAKRIIKKRIILAGLRLANEINQIASKRGERALTADQEAAFYKAVSPELKGGREPSSVTPHIHD